MPLLLTVHHAVDCARYCVRVCVCMCMDSVGWIAEACVPASVDSTLLALSTKPHAFLRLTTRSPKRLRTCRYVNVYYVVFSS